MKYFCFCTTALLSILFCCAQHNYEENKDKTIKDVIQKLGNVTLDSFSNLPPEEKANLLSKIEDKLNKSTYSLGPEGQKYVKFIMHAVKLIAHNNSKHDSIEVPLFITGKELKNETDETFKNKTVTPTEREKSKDEKIIKIANKIELLGKNAKTPKDKQKLIENIKRRLIESAKRKDMAIHSKHDKLKSYGDLIAKGIDRAMRRNEPNETKLINSVFDANINILNQNDKNTEIMDTSNIELQKEINFDNNTMDATLQVNNISELSCNNIVIDTCLGIRALKRVSCGSEHHKIGGSLKKICDGKADCVNGSDEEDCGTRAVEIVKSANRIMAEVESAMSKKCFSPIEDYSLLTRQNEILSNVLKPQLSLIQKHSNVTYSSNLRFRRVELGNTLILKKTVNEIATVVLTLAVALEKSLCSHEDKVNKNEVFAAKYSDIVSKDSDNQLIDTSPLFLKACSCKDQFCSSRICSNACKRFCFQKYNLNRWSCEGVNGGKSVPLDVICDGKLDCYDRTDENGCAPGAGFAKFEASVMFNDILSLLVTKSTSKEYEVARGTLLSLHASITLLEKLSKRKDNDVLTIKGLRDQCFEDLTSVYEAVANSEPSMNEVNDVYSFLLSLNAKLVSALKRSHSGNDRIISSDRCFCMEERCAQPTCSNMCVRACAAEPTLTKYFCGTKPSINISVPIEDLCNKKPNCPNGKDEEDCKTEVCRKHHLVLLRHNIKDAGERRRGTASSEALKSWKTKVTATLKIAENDDRPTPRVMKDIVSDILHDLVMTYATLDDFRRSNTDYILKEFTQISQNVIEILKSCGQ